MARNKKEKLTKLDIPAKQVEDAYQVVEQDETPEWPPFGLDDHGRYQADAGQEGAQAVHEYLNHQRGRIEDATKGPDYSECYQMRRPRVDET